MSYSLYPVVDGLVDQSGNPITNMGIVVSQITEYYLRMIMSGELTNRLPDGPNTPVQAATLAAFATANVKDFGALGNNVQTLVSDVYFCDIQQTQQTVDGAAINRAIRYLRSIGGGALYFPRGTYRTYGYLECIDSSIRIVGDGRDVSIIKSCDASPIADGYGIFRVGTSTPGTWSVGLITVSVETVTLDCNAAGRGMTAGHVYGELRAYPLAIYGAPTVSLLGMAALNSPIDCLLSQYESPKNKNPSGAAWISDTSCSLRAVSCTFDNAYRNTASLTSGWNQTFTSCSFLRGGCVGDGINPSAVLDIEPDHPENTIKNITFVGCRFRESVGQMISGTWCGGVKFSDSRFETVNHGTASKFTTIVRDGQFEFDGCVFENTDSWDSLFCAYPYQGTGDYASTQYIAVRNCTFIGTGMQITSLDMALENLDFKNSLYPIWVASTAGYLTVKNVKATNVLDRDNAGGGSFASFSVNSSASLARVVIDGLVALFDPNTVPSAWTGPSVPVFAYGLNFEVGVLSLKAMNVHAEGWYRRFPAKFSLTADANKYRDWLNAHSTGHLAPPDTSGQTAGPGAYFKSCTMWGDQL